MADNVPDVYVKLDGLKGESTDFLHPGKDGWVQIKGFNFGFGLKGADKTNLGSLMKAGKAGADLEAQNKALMEHLAQTQKQGKKGAAEKDEGPFDRPDVTLNKTLDLASTDIWKEKCYNGDPIPKVSVVACRYGGESGEEKIPFLTLIFENVYIKSVSLSLSADEPPTEAIHFRYDSVKLKYVWTSNDMGQRVRGASAPRAGWNFEENKPVEWGSDE